MAGLLAGRFVFDRRVAHGDHRHVQRLRWRQLTVLQDVYKSESDSNQRNQAIGALMLASGDIKANWPQAVALYTRPCSVGVNAKDLAKMAATLAAASALSLQASSASPWCYHRSTMRATASAHSGRLR